MQQINLYLDEFKEIEPAYSANMMLIINGYILVIGLLAMFVLVGVNQFKYHKNTTVKKSLEYWSNELLLAKTKYPEPKIDESLIKKIESLEQEQRRNSNILKYLNISEKEHFGVKFSGLLTGLARLNQGDIWLTKIEIAKSGSVIQLMGNALHSDAVPEYINKLSEVGTFSNIQFEKIHIEKGSEYITFSIGVETEDEKIGLSMEGAALQNR